MADAKAEPSATLTFKMATKSSVVAKDERGNESHKGEVIIGTLDWGSDSFAARSGPWGKGGLPTGTYTVRWTKLVEGSALSKGFSKGMTLDKSGTLKTSVKIMNPKDNTEVKRDLTGFFVPIEPDFETKRGGLGIHPDGNVYGTQGCIGLVGDAAEKFWHKVLKTAAKDRPAKLVVSGAVVDGQKVVIGASAKGSDE